MPSFFCHRHGYLILWAPNRGTGLMRKTQGSWLFGLGHLQILERFFYKAHKEIENYTKRPELELTWIKTTRKGQPLIKAVLELQGRTYDGDRDEAYFSTFEPCALTSPRISGAYGDQKWPYNPC